jgi:hypothetical protein
MTASSSSSRFVKECDSKRIESISVYSPKLAAGTAKRNIRVYNIIFLVLYVYQVGWVLTTIGEPYRKFLEKADREGFQGTNISGAKRLSLFLISLIRSHLIRSHLIRSHLIRSHLIRSHLIRSHLIRSEATVTLSLSCIYPSVSHSHHSHSHHSHSQTTSLSQSWKEPLACELNWNALWKT